MASPRVEDFNPFLTHSSEYVQEQHSRPQQNDLESRIVRIEKQNKKLKAEVKEIKKENGKLKLLIVEGNAKMAGAIGGVLEAFKMVQLNLTDRTDQVIEHLEQTITGTQKIREIFEEIASKNNQLLMLVTDKKNEE